MHVAGTSVFDVHPLPGSGESMDLVALVSLPGHVMQNRAAWRAGTAWLPWRGILCAAAAAVLQTCSAPLDIPRTMRLQTVVLFATPKILSDFANPEAGVARFLDHYSPLTSRASQTIVIFADKSRILYSFLC